MEDIVKPSFLSEKLTLYYYKSMWVSTFGLNYWAGPGFEPSPTDVHLPKTITHHVKPPRQSMQIAHSVKLYDCN